MDAQQIDEQEMSEQEMDEQEMDVQELAVQEVRLWMRRKSGNKHIIPVQPQNIIIM